MCASFANMGKRGNYGVSLAVLPFVVRLLLFIISIYTTLIFVLPILDIGYFRLWLNICSNYILRLQYLRLSWILDIRFWPTVQPNSMPRLHLFRLSGCWMLEKLRTQQYVQRCSCCHQSGTRCRRRHYHHSHRAQRSSNKNRQGPHSAKPTSSFYLHCLLHS